MLDRLRRPQLLFFLLVVLALLWLLWVARAALFPFVVGLVAAYLILPLVGRLQAWMPRALRERNLDRPVAILFVYLLGFGVLAVAANTVLNPLIREATDLADRSDELVAEGVQTVNELLDRYQKEIPPDLQSRIEAELQQFQPAALVQSLFAWGRGAIATIGNTLSFVLGLLIVPFWLYLVLNNEQGIVASLMGMVPPELRGDLEAIRIVMDRVLSSYVRGQVVVALTLGALLTIGMMLLRVPFALVLGFFAAVVALVPVLGAFLGAVPALVIAFFQEPILALWVALLFVGVQQIDNLFISPRVTGAAVSLPPALIMVLIVLGGVLMGPLGPIIIVPLAAILRDVVHYLYLRLAEPTPSPATALSAVGYPPSPRLIVAEVDDASALVEEGMA